MIDLGERVVCMTILTFKAVPGALYHAKAMRYLQRLINPVLKLMHVVV